MKKIIIVLLCLISPVLFATRASQVLASLLQKTHSINANFTQTVYDANKQQLTKSSGLFMFQQPNKFYWLIQQPMKQLIICNGQKIWNYQPDLAQVVVKPLTSGITATPLAMLSGSQEVLTKHFTVSQINDNTFKLVAKQHSNFQIVWLYFNAGVINAMTLQDALGQRTVLDFDNVQSGVNISANKFTFTPPKGVDIVKSM